MTQQQIDGTWQQPGEPTAYGLQPGYQQAPAEYGQQYPAPAEQYAVNPYQPAAHNEQYAGAAEQHAAGAYQSGAYGQPGLAYGQSAYQPQPYPPVAPAQPPHGGYGYYSPGGGIVSAGAVGEAPGVGTVVAITALFGLFGLIPASRSAKRAESLGYPSGKYWKAFAATLAASFALWTVLGFAIGGSGPSTDAAATTTTPATKITADFLQQSIVKNGDFKDEAGNVSKATAATCAPASVDANGTGTWRCMIDFGTDRESFEVSVGADGRWVTSRGE